MLTKPIRPWQNYRSFRAHICRNSSSEQFFHDNPNKWPCQTCRGRGKIVDPEYVACYESRTEYITCPDCKGSCVGPQEVARQNYKDAIAKYEAQIKEYREFVNLRRSAMSKLTHKEKEALLVIGL